MAERPKLIECRDLNIAAISETEFPEKMIVHGDIHCSLEHEDLVQKLIEQNVIVLDGTVVPDDVE
jgi:hypothetical protein